MVHSISGSGSRRRSAAFAILACLMSFAIFTLAQQSKPGADAIRQADTNWAKAAQTKQVDAWMAYYANEAVVLPPNDQLATSQTAIRKSISDLLTLPDLSISWEPTKVEVARSEELGYSYGTYRLTYSSPDSKPVTDRGKYLEIWKKQKDGTWKCAVDTWNSDMPLK
jgi:ketosteroid isomerase-like protein